MLGPGRGGTCLVNNATAQHDLASVQRSPGGTKSGISTACAVLTGRKTSPPEAISHRQGPSRAKWRLRGGERMAERRWVRQAHAGKQFHVSQRGSDTGMMPRPVLSPVLSIFAKRAVAAGQCGAAGRGGHRGTNDERSVPRKHPPADSASGAAALSFARLVDVASHVAGGADRPVINGLATQPQGLRHHSEWSLAGMATAARKP